MLNNIFYYIIPYHHGIQKTLLLNKGKWKKLYQEIDEILWNDWDPIGVNDIAPRDEYQSYTPIIFSLKRKGVNEEEIAKELYEIEKETIGLAGNLENCRIVARKIIELNE